MSSTKRVDENLATAIHRTRDPRQAGEEKFSSGTVVKLCGSRNGCCQERRNLMNSEMLVPILLLLLPLPLVLSLLMSLVLLVLMSSHQIFINAILQQTLMSTMAACHHQKVLVWLMTQPPIRSISLTQVNMKSYKFPIGTIDILFVLLLVIHRLVM
jgi:hypothetical protein